MYNTITQMVTNIIIWSIQASELLLYLFLIVPKYKYSMDSRIRNIISVAIAVCTVAWFLMIDFSLIEPKLALRVILNIVIILLGLGEHRRLKDYKLIFEGKLFIDPL